MERSYQNLASGVALVAALSAGVPNARASEMGPNEETRLECTRSAPLAECEIIDQGHTAILKGKPNEHMYVDLHCFEGATTSGDSINDHYVLALEKVRNGGEYELSASVPSVAMEVTRNVSCRSSKAEVPLKIVLRQIPERGRVYETPAAVSDDTRRGIDIQLGLSPFFRSGKYNAASSGPGAMGSLFYKTELVDGSGGTLYGEFGASALLSSEFVTKANPTVVDQRKMGLAKIGVRYDPARNFSIHTAVHIGADVGGKQTELAALGEIGPELQTRGRGLAFGPTFVRSMTNDQVIAVLVNLRGDISF